MVVLKIGPHRRELRGRDVREVVLLEAQRAQALLTARAGNRLVW